MSKKNMPATPFLRASPNPVPIGCDPGTTTINWSAGHEEAEVYVTRDGEQEKPFAQGSHGSQDAPWINRGSTYQFRLYGRGPRITPLATVTVRPCEATAPIWEPGCVSFYCNICGQACLKKLEELERESRSCAGCGSTVRWRSVIHALSIELFGESIPLSDFPVMPEITGIGMSDWNGYAIPLAQKFSYQNTYYHQDPKLDITAIDPALEGKFDFIISSDVFEHIAPPVSAAFENVRKLLKPNGALVFTVPYWKHDRTVEHFPELCDYKILEKNGNYVLMNTTRNGVVQVFDELVFHEGPGSTLEMRMFSELSLIEEFKKAGFNNVKIHREPAFDYGIYWKYDFAFPMSARVSQTKSLLGTRRL